MTMKKKLNLKRKTNVLRGTKLSYNAALQNDYYRAIRKLTDKMISTTKREIIRLFESKIADAFFDNQELLMAQDGLYEDLIGNKIKREPRSLASKSRILLNSLNSHFSSVFNEKSSKLANKMLNSTKKSSQASLKSSFNKIAKELTINTGIVTKGLEEVTKALITDNVSLIESIPSEYFKNITSSVMQSITTGNGLPDLIPKIERTLKTANKSLGFYDSKVKERAKRIAYDQTRKAYTAVNQQRMTALGVKKFEWLHSYGGLEPRRSHVKIDGKIFSFDHVEEEQEKLKVPPQDQGMPGYPFNCRCSMAPVIEFDD